MTPKKHFTLSKSDHERLNRDSTAWINCFDSKSGFVDLTGERCFLPGSFDPLHNGHLQMAAFAERQTKMGVWFELSVTNVEKKPLTAEDVARRVSQDFSHHGLVVSRLPTFAEKAIAFPGSTFVVGADTIERVNSGTYYRDRKFRRDCVAQIAANQCRFLVFGRLMDGTFQELDDLGIESDLRQLCVSVKEREFRSDWSSSELRLRNKN